MAASMPSRANSPLSLLDVLRAVVKYRWRTFYTFLLLSSLAVLAIVLFPKKFESESKVFVRLGRGSVTMDTAATTGQTVAIQESREPEMNSVVDMLESRQLVEAVVRRVGAKRILEKHSAIEIWMENLSGSIPEFSFASSDFGPSEMTESEIEAQEAVELAIKYISGNTRIDSPKKSTTVSITSRARTPRLAKDLNTAFLEEFKKIHLAAYQASGSLGFFERNFLEQDALLKRYEDEMRAAKNEMSLITIDGKQSSLQDQITSVQKDIAIAQAELSAAESRLNDLNADMGQLPSEISGEITSGIANAASDSMRSQLYDLEIKENELGAKYADTHPKLVNLRAQIAQASAVLARQEPERETSTTKPNPVRQDTHVLLLKEKAAVAGLVSKVRSLRSIESELTEELERVNLFEVKSADLQRKIDLSRENHRTYARKLEESRIVNELDKEAISNVSVVQPPTFTLKHVSPKRSVLGLLGGFFAFLGSVLVAVVSDRYRDEDSDQRNALLIQAEERLLRMKAEPWGVSIANVSPPRPPITHSAHSDSTPSQDDGLIDSSTQASSAMQHRQDEPMEERGDDDQGEPRLPR